MTGLSAGVSCASQKMLRQPSSLRPASATPTHHRGATARCATVTTTVTQQDVRADASVTSQVSSTSSSISHASSSSTTAAAPKASRVQEIDPDEFNRLMEQQDGLILVDFYMDLCGPCQVMHKELERISEAFPTVTFHRLNSGKFDKEFTTRQRVRSMPTIKVYFQGKCLDEVTGAKPVVLRQMLSDLVFRFA